MAVAIVGVASDVVDRVFISTVGFVAVENCVALFTIFDHEVGNKTVVTVEILLARVTPAEVKFCPTVVAAVTLALLVKGTVCTFNIDRFLIIVLLKINFKKLHPVALL